MGSSREAAIVIELPEAITLARQLDAAVQGRRITEVVAASSPHRFAWYHGDPADYPALLRGKTVGAASQHGGFVELTVADARLLLCEGVALRHYGPGERRPPKHQLLLELDDGAALVASVQMYGGLWAYPAGAFTNAYLERAQRAPSPLSEAFDLPYFDLLACPPAVRKLSLKAFLATEQRVPGLGNGVLQDVLHCAGLHPRRTLASLDGDALGALHGAVVSTLAAMAHAGGRDTERDLHGRPGGYATQLSRRTLGRPCRRCGATIVKEPYLGGAIYWCPGCQRA
jgi:formamidopyrimidine-DNA glycosylase